MGLLFTKTRSKDRPVRLHLAGSMGDGQFTARLIADNIEVEYDIMYLSKVEIKNESHLEYVPDATGFVRILRNRDRDLRHLPHNGTFINGCQLKEDIHSIIKANQVRSLETSSTSIDQASIFLQYNDLWPPVDREIIRKLQTMRQELTNERRRNAQRNIEQYFLFAKSLINFQFKDDFGNISKRLFNINLSNEYLDKQREKANHIIEIYQILYMSLIGISIPSELTNKIRLLVNFYNKYRHMVNEDIFQQRYSQVRQRITMTEDCDVVVALKLSFWPSVARKRLRYWKQYKPIIYRKVRKSTVYVIPKWSKMTAEDDGSYEFRLSFSNAEEILAKSRSKSEKMLNDIARTIYYKHLRKPVTFSHDCVHSYFIKTVVLWMCEEFDLQNNYRDIIDEKQIRADLTNRFVNYARENLDKGECPHYFINEINVLSMYTSEARKEAFTTLENIELTDVLQSNFDNWRPEFLTITPEMLSEFRELQEKGFFRQTSFFVPKRFEPALQSTFWNFLINEDRNRNWWKEWINFLLNNSTDRSVTEENQENATTDITITDIELVLSQFTETVQRRWPFLNHLIFEDDPAKEYIISRREVFVRFASRMSHQWVYDTILHTLKQNHNTKHILSTIEANKSECSIPISETETLAFPINIVIHEFWDDFITDVVGDILTLIGAGYSFAKFIFATDEHYQRQNPISARFLPLIRAFSLIRNALRLKK